MVLLDRVAAEKCARYERIRYIIQGCIASEYQTGRLYEEVCGWPNGLRRLVPALVTVVSSLGSGRD